MDVIRRLLSSEKAVMTLVGILANVILHVCAKLGWGVTPDEASAIGMKIVLAVGAYVGAQSVSDHGEAHAEATVEVAKANAAASVEVATIHADAGAVTSVGGAAKAGP